LDTDGFQLINEKGIKGLEYYHSAALKELTERGNSSVTNTPKGEPVKYSTLPERWTLLPHLHPQKGQSSLHLIQF